MNLKNIFMVLIGSLFGAPCILFSQYSLTIVDDPELMDVYLNRIVSGPHDETLLLGSTDIFTYTDHVTNVFSCSLCDEIRDVAFIDDTMYIANNWTGIIKRVGDSLLEVSPFNILRLVAGKGCKLYGIEFDAGIVTWDGSEWKHLTTANSTIPTDYIYDLAVDTNGLLWMATYVGLVSWNGLGFSLKSVPDDLSSTFYNLTIDYFQNVWVSSAYGGVGRYKNGTWKTFPTTFGPFDLVQNLGETNGNKIWTSEIGEGLYKFNGIAFEVIPYQDLGLTDWNNNTILFGDSQNRLWIENDFMPLMYLTTGTTALHDYYHNALNLSVYPNPASKDIYIDFGREQTTTADLKVFSIDGRLIHSEHLSSTTVVKMNVNGWAPGLYQAIVEMDDAQVYKGRICVIPN